MSTVDVEVSEEDAQLRNRKDSQKPPSRKNSKPPTGKATGGEKREQPQRQQPDTATVESSPAVGDAADARLSILCDRLRQEILSELQDRLKVTVDSALERLQKHAECHDLMQSSNWLEKNMSDKMQPTDPSDCWLPEKSFKHRNSVLTDLFKISHIRSVYHIFVAILIIFSLNTMLSDLVEKGGIVHTYHLELFVWVFRGLYDTLVCWLAMFTSTSLGVYVTFLIWSTCRAPTPSMNKLDWVFLALYLLYQAVFCILPVIFVFEHNLAPATSLIVTLEQVRMLMKSHAFIRTNAMNAFIPTEVAKLVEPSSPGGGSEKRPYNYERFPSVAIGDGPPSQPDKELCMSNTYPLPSFSTYLYFLFAPTLIYSNSYPRTPYVRWRIVAENFLQVGLCVIYNYYIFARFCFSHFANFGRSNHFTFSPRELVISSFGCMLPGAMVLLITFYAFLHCWLNAFAEMLRFGDRLFYKDWWNSFTFSAYYRGWNVVVHDWLYTYVYRDVYALCSPRRRRFAAQAAVFLLSALVHEYILVVVFRFFYPVLFVMFGIAGFGIAHLKARSRFWNIGIWVGLFMGMGIIMCLYSMEWYARLNCPPAPGGWLRDMLLPRSWFCRRW